MYDITLLVKKLNILIDGKIEISGDGQSLYAHKDNIVELMQILKETFIYIMLVDITAVDYNNRFEMVYHLLNEDAAILRVKVKLEKCSSAIPSIVSVWRAADVQEREVYDMMGIVFEGHNNLKRILCKDDFEGHPLRKDFKLDIVSRF